MLPGRGHRKGKEKQVCAKGQETNDDECECECHGAYISGGLNRS